MEYVASLLQTILWVALIVGILWRFNKPIHGLLTALQKRIESGSTLKAGPFELSEQVMPQPVNQQVQRTEAEVSEVVRAQAEETSHKAPDRSEIKSRFLEAEDLALRAVQVHYGKPISRQVSLGQDFGFDGAFTNKGEMNIVEVKYLVRPKRGYEIVRSTLGSFQALFNRYHWRRIRVVLAVVLQFPSDVEETRREIVAMAKEFEFPVEVHCFSLPELRARFGLADG